MKIIDLNILLYVINTSFEQHKAIYKWWLDNLNGDGYIGLTWNVLSGFIRLSTNPRIFPQPLSTKESLIKVDAWLKHPNTVIVQESKDHFNILSELLESVGSAGNLTTDAHLAAIAIGHGAAMVSCDNDFARFSHLRWINPMRD
ncbi:MAG: TA system VapC family ribonuclease toxin [Thiohalomonadales bacterium]